jgi:succinate dehydrogenase / fumarate reductase cytochrome b subunit
MMREFHYKRLMSLLGIVACGPLSIYGVLHLWTRRHPAFLFQGLELLLGVALLGHVVLGARQLRRWRPNLLYGLYGPEARTFGNLLFSLQRLSALVLILFIVLQMIYQMVYQMIWGRLRPPLSPALLAVYILGLASASYHVANGLRTALITWGVTVTPRAQRAALLGAIGLLAVLLSMSGLALYGFLQPGYADRAGQ